MSFLSPPRKLFVYATKSFFAAGVIIIGKLWMRWKISRAENEEHVHEKSVNSE